jgi:hypothetical protein
MLSLIRVSIAATLFALPLIVALHTPAYACSCAAPTIEEQVQEASLIVIGTATDHEIVGAAPTPPPPASPPDAYVPPVSAEIETTVAVDDYLKGSGPEVLGVREYAEITFDEGNEPQITEGLTSLCNFALDVDEAYVLFLYRRDDGELVPNWCGGVVWITSENEAEVAALIAQVEALLEPPVAATATVVADELPPAGSAGGATRNAPWTTIAIGGALAAAALLSGYGWRLLRR